MNFLQINYFKFVSFLKGSNAIYVLLLITFGLRIHNFSSASIWTDESITLDIIHKNVIQILKVSLKDVNAPLYTLITHFWSLVFGFSVPAIRFLSITCSTLTAAVIFKTADKNFGRTGALAAGLLFCFSNIHIYYSEEARCYALLCFMASLSLYYFFEFIKSPGYKNVILYSFFSLLTMYTQFFFGLQLALQGLLILIFCRKNAHALKIFIGSQVVTALLFSAWFVPTFLFISRTGINDSWVPPLSADNVLWYFRDLVNTQNLFYGFSILYAAFFIFAGIKAKQNKADVFLLGSSFALFALPFVIICLISYLVIPIFYPRYVLFTSIPLFISFGFCVSYMPKKWYIKLLLSALIIFMAINVTISAFRNQEWDKACALEPAFTTDSSCVVLSPYYTEFCYIYYNMGWVYKEEFNNLYYFKDVYRFNNMDDSSTFKNRGLDKYLRVIYYDSNTNQDHRLPTYFRNHYDSVFARKFYGVDFYVFDRKEDTVSVKENNLK